MEQSVSVVEHDTANHVIGKMNGGCFRETVRFVPTVKSQEVNHTNVDQDGRYCNGF